MGREGREGERGGREGGKGGRRKGRGREEEDQSLPSPCPGPLSCSPGQWPGLMEVCGVWSREVRGRQRPCGPGTLGQKEGRMVGTARGWPPVCRGQEGREGHPRLKGASWESGRGGCRWGGEPQNATPPHGQTSPGPKAARRDPFLQGNPGAPQSAGGASRTGDAGSRPLPAPLGGGRPPEPRVLGRVAQAWPEPANPRGPRSRGRRMFAQ